MTKAAAIWEQRQNHIHFKLWFQLKELAERFLNVHILIANIMLRICATTAIIVKVKPRKPMRANILIRAITPVVCAKIAT